MITKSGLVSVGVIVVIAGVLLVAFKTDAPQVKAQQAPHADSKIAELTAQLALYEKRLAQADNMAAQLALYEKRLTQAENIIREAEKTLDGKKLLADIRDVLAKHDLKLSQLPLPVASGELVVILNNSPDAIGFLPFPVKPGQFVHAQALAQSGGGNPKGSGPHYWVTARVRDAKDGFEFFLRDHRDVSYPNVEVRVAYVVYQGTGLRQE